MDKRLRLSLFSVGIAVFVFIFKIVSYFLTNSIALLTDSVETVNNILASLVLFFSMKKSLKPPDKEHPYGHYKMEYVSSFLEGVLIVSMGIILFYISIRRFFIPFELQKLDAGMVLSGTAGVINLFAGIYLYKSAKKIHSIAIETDAKHLFSDVGTTVGMLIGLLFVIITGKKLIDPIMGLLLSTYISFLGAGAIIKTADEMLDKAIDESEMMEIKKILYSYSSKYIEFHELRTRRAGKKKFLDLHLVFHPDEKLVDVHRICDEIEEKIKEKIKNIDITIHPEPLEEKK